MEKAFSNLDKNASTVFVRLHSSAVIDFREQVVTQDAHHVGAERVLKTRFKQYLILEHDL